MTGRGGGSGDAALSLLVIYTEPLEACREFYEGLGLRLVREQHGAGPVHYPTELAHGLVAVDHGRRRDGDRPTDRRRAVATLPA